jgi:hypothetical protein
MPKINIQSGQHVTRVREIEQRHLCDVFSELRSFVFVYTVGRTAHAN